MVLELSIKCQGYGGVLLTYMSYCKLKGSLCNDASVYDRGLDAHSRAATSGEASGKTCLWHSWRMHWILLWTSFGWSFFVFFFMAFVTDELSLYEGSLSSRFTLPRCGTKVRFTWPSHFLRTSIKHHAQSNVQYWGRSVPFLLLYAWPTLILCPKI